jgi:hypothetical protein
VLEGLAEEDRPSAERARDHGDKGNHVGGR